MAPVMITALQVFQDSCCCYCATSAAAAAMIPSETAPPSMTAVEFDALMLRHLDGVRRRCDEEAEAAAVVSKVQMESEEVTYSSLAF